MFLFLNSGYSHPFGYHLNTVIGKKYIRNLNISNFAGYFLGPIIGLARIILFAYLCCTKKTTDYKLAQIARGVMEVLCFSIFLAAIDLLATARRYHWCCC